MGKLNGKVAIVTGAGSGMGRATALELSKQGATVVIAELREEAALETEKLVKEAGGECTIVVGDISVSENVQQLINTTIEVYEKIDVLANVAGMPMSFTPIEEVSEELFDKQLNVNTKAAFLTSKYAVPHMKEAGGGSIINISSIASERPRPGLTAYCAAKGGVVLLTKALAIEVADKNIRVNAINPGPAETPMLKEFYGSMDPVEGRKLYTESVPIGRLCDSQDIANMIAYLASDDASFITGSVYNVDGGRGL